MRHITCSRLLGATLSVTAALALAPAALGASPAVKIGTGSSSTPPSVVVDGSGTAYIVWTTLPTATAINYCKLPAGASACAVSSTIALSGGGAVITAGDPQILLDGATLVVLADVTSEGATRAENGVQEWTSESPYSGFAKVLGGQAVNFVGENAGTIGAVTLPGSAPYNLGVAWEIPGSGGGAQFEESPFGPVTAQSQASSPEPKHAALDPANSLGVSNAGGVIASQTGVRPGVLGVFNTLEDPPCKTFGTAFAYAPGTPSAASYDEAANVAGTAWQSPLAQLDCGVSYPAVGGGPDGFGVVEQDEATTPTSIVYHRFDESTGKFDLPEVKISAESGHGTSVSQDGSGNIYATWLGNGIRFASSADAGASWTVPVTINADPAVNDLTSSVGSSGQGWASWVDASGPATGPIYAQPFGHAAATSGPTQTVSVGGDNVSLSSPGQCVRNGLLNSEVKVSLPSAKRKGKVVVRIYEVIFKVAGQTRTLKRSHLSNAPFRVTIHLKHVASGTKLILTAHALIAVIHGPKRSKTLRITLTAC